MKVRSIILAILLMLPVAANAQQPTQQKMSASQLALRIDEAIGQLATAAEAAQAQAEQLQQQVTSLQKQVDDLKAKYEPKQ